MRPNQKIHSRDVGEIPSLSRRRCSPTNSNDDALDLGNALQEPSSPRRITTATSTEYQRMPRVVEQVQAGPPPFRRNAEDKEVTPNDLEKLKEELEELVVELKKPKRFVPEGEDHDIQEAFLRRLYAPGTVKYYTGLEHGFKILEDAPTNPTAIQASRLNILDFVYRQSREPTELSPLVTDILDKVDDFIGKLNTSQLRSGAFSVAVDFSSFPPSLTSRAANANNIEQMLRPVVIDGVAVQYASSISTFRPFSRPTLKEMKKNIPPPWSHFLNLSVKPLFHIIVSFLIRGHKTKAYLPMYYKNFITNGGVAKVDDIFAFKKLIDLELIEFKEFEPSDKNWFSVVARVADQLEGVFVSSADFRKRPAVPKFEKASERIVTPCFLNDQDRLMVLEPTIRYRDQNGRFKVIPAEQILTFGWDPHFHNRLDSQLYLENQIRLICELCLVYPMKSMQKVSIQQLLLLCLRADSGIEMPGMEEDDYKNIKFEANLEQSF